MEEINSIFEQKTTLLSKTEYKKKRASEKYASVSVSMHSALLGV